MPHWRMIALLAAGFASAGMAGVGPGDTVTLNDGKPVTGRLSGQVRIAFDGHNVLEVDNGTRSLRLDPRTPAVLSASQDARFLVLNFGDGSGQVYGLSAYDLRSGAPIDLSRFVNSVLSFARRTGSCQVNQDEISFVFTRWNGAGSIEVKTEDFTRTPDCSAINRTWVVDLAHRVPSGE